MNQLIDKDGRVFKEYDKLEELNKEELMFVINSQKESLKSLDKIIRNI
jgi:hypothetical protein